MGQAVHAPPQAHGLPDGGGRRDNFPAGAMRLRTRLGCRGFRLNRRVASASFCARAARCRKGSVLLRTGRSAGGLRGGRSSCQPRRVGDPALRLPTSPSQSVILPRHLQRAHRRRSARMTRIRWCPCHVCRTGWSACFRGLPFMKKRPARQKPMTRCPFLGTCISPIDKMLSMWVRWAWAPCRVQEVPGSGRRCLVRSDYRVPAPGAAASTNTASGSRRRPSQMPRPSWDQRARPADDVHRSG